MNADYQRPQALYRYDGEMSLQRALTLGEFHLQPANQCLTLGFSSVFDPSFFDLEVDACLIIHQPEEFGERLHRAVQRLLPNWAGIDGAVEYGRRSVLGNTFSKSREEQAKHEWLFAWRPLQTNKLLQTLLIKVGDISKLAEVRNKTACLN
jgi:hypothetical protein